MFADFSAVASGTAELDFGRALLGGIAEAASTSN